MINYSQLEHIERNSLKAYACFSDMVTRGHLTKKHPFRTEFQRDRDRIIHSKSFRRLEFKTQVYLSTQNDHMRTRLTHSLEVSQIARTVAMQLGVNVDLVEAIALGHDVGHTPFGHAAERELHDLAIEEGLYFKHNMQSVRILDKLEEKYAYEGLGLTVPVLEGILKHSKFYNKGETFFADFRPDLKHSFTIEGQIVEIADEIAQITHDTDDYLRANIIELDAFLNHSIFNHIIQFYHDRYDYKLDFDEYETDAQKKEIVIRCLVDFLVTTLITETEKVLNNDLVAMEIDNYYMTYGQFNEIVKDFHETLKKNCFSNFGVKEMDRRGKDMVRTLYKFYVLFPERLPEVTMKKYSINGPIVLLDHISGMTDKYAIEQYNSLIRI